MLVDFFFDLRRLRGLVAEMQIHLRLADGGRRSLQAGNESTTQILLLLTETHAEDCEVALRKVRASCVPSKRIRRKVEQDFLKRERH